MLLLSNLYLSLSAYDACVGKSVGLPPKECLAWQDFFDKTNGPNWANWGSDGRNDPCSVKSKIGNPCKGGPPSSMALRLKDQARSSTDVPWQEPDAGVCCENGHITQLAFGINGLQGEVVSGEKPHPSYTI
jgi:hypothetical protein